MWDGFPGHVIGQFFAQNDELHIASIENSNFFFLADLKTLNKMQVDIRIHMRKVKSKSFDSLEFFTKSFDSLEFF